MPADNIQGHSTTNPIENQADTAIQQEWLDHSSPGITGETLKAKQWTTSRRLVDDASHHGNIHTGTEQQEDLEKSGIPEEDAPVPQSLDDDIKKTRHSEESENHEDISVQRSFNVTEPEDREAAPVDSDDYVRPDDTGAVVGSGGSTPLVFEKHFDDPVTAEHPATERKTTHQSTPTTTPENTPPTELPPTEPIPPPPINPEIVPEIPPTDPTLTTSDASGIEDTPLTIEVSSQLTDSHASESLTIFISGVPAGASLSAGTDLGNGEWQLTPDELEGLTLSPPVNSDETFSLTITATSTDSINGQERSVSEIIDVFIDAVADAPILSTQAAQGIEDDAISLNINSALVDTDGSESLSNIHLTGVPEGAILSAGSKNPDGSWSLTQEDLVDLSITPPKDSDNDFELSLSVTSTDSNGSTATSTALLPVTVTGSNDGPVATDDLAATDESSAITIDVLANDSDIDGDALIVTDATVADGSGSVAINDDGTLAFDPGSDFEQLPVGTSQEVEITYSISDGHGGTDTATATVTVTGSNDGPVATDDLAATDESSAIIIDVLANDSDIDGDTLTVTDATVADGSGSVTINDDGTLAFDPGTDFEQLGPGEAQNVEITYSISDDHGETDTATATVTVTGTNEAPSLDLGDNKVIIESFENFRDSKGWHIEHGEGPDNTVTGDHGTQWNLADQGLEIQRGNIGGSRASDGESHIEMDVTHNTSFSTTVNVIEEETYNLSFSYKPRPGKADTSDMNVTLGDKELSIESDARGNLTFTASDGVEHQATKESDGWYTISVEFNNLSDGNTELTFTGTGKSDSLGAYVDDIQLIHSADDASYTAQYEENSDGVAIVGDNIHIGDTDGSSLSSASITLTNTQSDDQLEVNDLPTGITAETSLDTEGNITVTLTGDAPHADYQEALQAVTFSNSGDVPDTTDRDITITIHDGHGGTTTTTTTVAVSGDIKFGAGDDAFTANDLSDSLPSMSLSEFFDDPTDAENVSAEDINSAEAPDPSATANEMRDIPEETLDTVAANDNIQDTADNNQEEELSLNTDDLHINLEGETPDADSAPAETDNEESDLEKFSANGDSGENEEVPALEDLDTAETDDADQVEDAGLGDADAVQEELLQEPEQVDVNGAG